MYLVSIPASISRILMSPLGSRVKRPKYGSLLYTLKDREFNDSFRVKATKYVYEAIKENEPRAVVKRLIFIPDAVSGQVKLKIILDNNDEVEVRIK